MKPSGFRSYESAWRIHVAPRWSKVRISDVTHTDVQAWVSELAVNRCPVIVQTVYLVLATLDVYADLFDDDLTAVADKLDESVGKMWARRAAGAPDPG
jgi:hypothetical protein